MFLLLSPEQITIANACEEMYVDENGIGFVYMEEYAQSHAKPNYSGKTKEQVWEEVQSYHQIEGTIPEGSRVETAVYDAMERFTNQDGCKVVPWQSCPVCDGSGQVYQPLSTGILRTCPTCNGERIIPMHVITSVEPKETNQDGWVSVDDLQKHLKCRLKNVLSLLNDVPEIKEWQVLNMTNGLKAPRYWNYPLNHRYENNRKNGQNRNRCR